MASSPQLRSVSASRATVRDLLAIANAVKEEFRAERIIAMIVVTAALLVGISTAIFAAIQGNSEGTVAILFGSGGVCTIGVSALFYMYNRSLVFMERMAGVQKGSGDHD